MACTVGEGAKLCPLFTVLMRERSEGCAATDVTNLGMMHLLTLEESYACLQMSHKKKYALASFYVSTIIKVILYSFGIPALKSDQTCRIFVSDKHS